MGEHQFAIDQTLRIDQQRFNQFALQDATFDYSFSSMSKSIYSREDPHTFYGNHKCGFPNGKIGYFKMNQP